MLTFRNMRSLNLPLYSYKTEKRGESEFIFDDFRKKYVRLTPEEWVRQNFANYLVSDRQFPQSRIVIEKSLTFNTMSKRCDILVYDDFAKPVLMVECKAPGISIVKTVFDQISVYNMVFKVRYLLVTNGISHYACTIDFENRRIDFLKEIPYYKEIL
jgi:hypothetical protein